MQARRFRKLVHHQVDKVFAQDSRARLQLRLWNDKQQNAARRQPAVGVLQKYQFLPLVVCLADFKVIRRIEIEQRKCFRWTAHIESIGLQCFDSQRSSLLGPVPVNFDPVAVGFGSVEQMRKRDAVSDAWIKSRKLWREDEAISQAFGLRHWQRIETQLGLSLWSHRVLPPSASATRASTASKSDSSRTAINEQNPFTGT